MRKNTLLFPFLLLSVIMSLVSGCKKDDDKDEPSNDPRVRKIWMREYDDYDFVINDIEGKIYNYDSLPYGSKVTALLPYFYGYSSSVLSVMVSRPDTNIMSPYGGTQASEAIDFTKPVIVLTTAEDGISRKTYTMEVRVHKYDVDAFEWERIATIDATEKTLSQGSITINGEYRWYVRTSSGSSVWKSVSETEWTKEAVSDFSYDFTSLCEVNGTVYCGTEDGKLLSSEDGVAFIETEVGGVVVDKVLFAIEGKVWMFGGDSLYSYIDTIYGENKIPSDFPLGGVRPFSAQSGYTTIGYVLANNGENSEVWGIDRMGNIVKLSGGVLPYLEDACVFKFENTLGIIGGRNKNGVLQSVCFASTNGGLTWTNDWHKDMGEQVGAIAGAALFVTNKRGEMLLVGGETQKGYEGSVYKCRLKRLIQEEEYFNSIK